MVRLPTALLLEVCIPHLARCNVVLEMAFLGVWVIKMLLFTSKFFSWFDLLPLLPLFPSQWFALETVGLGIKAISY